MRLSTKSLEVKTKGCGLIDITPQLSTWLTSLAVDQGQLTLFVRHTSASLVIQENADPDVLRDLENFMQRLAPWQSEIYQHNAEGPDDMPAHIRSALTNVSLSIPIINGRLALGTWQAVYLWEHRKHPQTREILAQILQT